MSENLVFHTRKSIYPSIEFKVEDVTYISNKFTHPLRIVLEPLEKKIDVTTPDWDSLCKWMTAVFGIKKEILDQLETDEVEDIYMRVKVELLKRQKNRMDKNLSALDSEVQGIKATTEKAKGITETAGEIEKNVKGPGKKT